MTRNLKALGLALLAVFVLGAIGAQGVSAADAHEFHSDGSRTVLTGKNVGVYAFQVGAAGTVECTSVTFESTSLGSEVTPTTYNVDEITVKPEISGCAFGGQPATVVFNDCAHAYDSDTTAGNFTGGKHASMTIECSQGNKIEVHTVNCTLTIGAQTVTDRVRYENHTASSIKIVTTAHGIVVGKERNTAVQPANGCLLFPTGAIGKLLGTATAECRQDEEAEAQADPTTPGPTKDVTTTQCTVTDV